MKKVTVTSAEGLSIELQVPEFFEWFPAEFQEAARNMSCGDCRLLAGALLEAVFPQEMQSVEPTPDEIADAARRGLTAMERIPRR